MSMALAWMLALARLVSNASVNANEAMRERVTLTGTATNVGSSSAITAAGGASGWYSMPTTHGPSLMRYEKPHCS